MTPGSAAGAPELATALAAEVRSGRRSARSVVDEALERIDQRNPQLRAFHHVEHAAARARADALDAGGPGSKGSLAGVPIALKANMCWAGHVSDCGSQLLRDYRAPYTATFVERLIAAGAVPVGTTHMDEFAMGSSGENSAFAATRNPWDLERVPGGSSSGSAAAVAAGLVPIALGSDTGGSVRQPASFCGIAGFKPTYGRVSRYGLVAFASSLDQVAPFARSIDDLEAVLNAVSGADELDATTLQCDPIAAGNDAFELRGLRIATSSDLLPQSVEEAVRSRFDTALALLANAGAQFSEVQLPSAAFANPTYYVIATAEASSNLARYDGVRYGARAEDSDSLASMMSATRRAGFGREVQRRILVGTHALSAGYSDAWYGRAQRVRRRIALDFEQAFEDVDLIACPTSPTPAFARGERVDNPLAMYAADTLTVPANLAGLPAISLPAGSVLRDGRELPVGLQLIGPRGSDERVLQAARAFQGLSGADAGWPAAPQPVAPEPVAPQDGAQ